jgi:hypothetical protein
MRPALAALPILPLTWANITANGTTHRRLAAYLPRSRSYRAGRMGSTLCGAVAAVQATKEAGSDHRTGL